MVTGATANTNARRKAAFIVAVVCLSLLPLVAPVATADGGRAISVQMTAIPTALEVNPGEGGEYTIRVRNNGDNPITVQLATSNEGDDCANYAATISQISGPIDSGSYEEASLNISLSQTAEGSCDTTVTANINEQVTPPDVADPPTQESVTVTTTAGDGSGSALYGVDLTIAENQRSKTWAGEDELSWLVTVENTGRTNETISLEVTEGSGPGCMPTSDYTVSLSDDIVSLDEEESDTVTVTVEIPDGPSADKYCWEIEGSVTNDIQGEAKDTEDFDLTVPELKECTVALSKTSVSVNPGDDTTITATYANTGNVGWTVHAIATGAKASQWVSVDGASSGMLPYDNGNGEREFDFIIAPDDSVTAGSETVITIVGKESATGPIKEDCQTNLRVIVGQSRGASISLANALLSNIEPGSNKSTTITVTNEGNGQDNLRIASSIAPTGWAVQLEQSTVSVGSRHNSNEKSATVDVTVRVPTNALATEEIELTFSVLPSSGGAAYDTVTLRVTVAAVHGFDIITPATDQTGRSGTEVRFPIDVVNEGNVRDTIGFSVVSQTASPAWGTSFENEAGMPFTELDVEPQTTARVYLVVSIDGEEELENSRLTVRVRNKDDPNSQDRDNDGIPDNQRQGEFLAILSDREFSMDLRLQDTDTATSASVVLPPSGERVIGMWVSNTGDGNDEAVFTLGGLEGIATRSLTAFGMPVSGELTVPKGYGIWDLKNNTYVLQESGQPYLAIDQDAAELKMLELGLTFDDHRAQPYEIYVELTLRVNPGAQTGQGGLLEILVTSVSNAADRSGLVTVSLEVSIVHELAFVEAGERQEVDIIYGQKAAEKQISIINTGNVRAEIRVFASENLRGWSVVLDDEGNLDCQPENNDLLCMVDEGEQLNITVIIRAPYGAEMEDLYKFTVSAEPTETGVLDRQNIEFAAQGSPAEGVLGLSNAVVAQAAGGVLLLLVLVALFVRRK
jgi:uncharacterized membrane protein